MSLCVEVVSFSLATGFSEVCRTRFCPGEFEVADGEIDAFILFMNM